MKIMRNSLIWTMVYCMMFSKSLLTFSAHRFNEIFNFDISMLFYLQIVSYFDIMVLLHESVMLILMLTIEGK